VSRVGKLPITIPNGVTLDIKKNVVTAKGPKGELSVEASSEMQLTLKDGVLTIERPSESKPHRAQHGLYRALIANIVKGVSEGFEKRLEIIGVGYRAEIINKNLLLGLGFSHDILFKPPEGIEITTEGKGNNIIIVKGIDKQLVGQVAAKLRALRPPEPYKGKGIRYEGETVRRKAGKTAA